MNLPLFYFSCAQEYAPEKDPVTNALEAPVGVVSTGDPGLPEDPSVAPENRDTRWLEVEDVCLWSVLLASPSSIVTGSFLVSA